MEQASKKDSTNKEIDQYNWKEYTDNEYEWQLSNMVAGGIDLFVKNVTDTGTEIIFQDNLNANSKQIYQTIYKLEPKSVFEAGCGAGMHIVNIKYMFPNIDVDGADISQEQMDIFAKKYNKTTMDQKDPFECIKNLKVKNLCDEDGIEELGKHEFVYTNAVAMHLSFENVKKFLVNLGKLSSKYILLLENLDYHDFPKLLKECLPEFEYSSVVGAYTPNLLLKRKEI